MTAPDVLLIAPPTGRRARAFQASLAALGWPPARVVSYLELLRGEVHLTDLVRPGTVVRFDSPGEHADTERALIERGGAQAGDLAGGELAPMRAWYAGFAGALRELLGQLDRCAPHRRMQDVEHVLTMFDKAATHARLAGAGVPVPPALPEVDGAEALFEAAVARGWSRVFVKLAYGSSASGAVALQWRGSRVSAVTTVHMEGGRLFNSRRLRQYSSWAEVRTLVDALARHRVHVERWLPKVSFQGRTIDLRVVVIGGTAGHTVVRSARGPITNLHLGNERGDVDALRGALGEAGWAHVQGVAEGALAAFPGALYGGVDVLLTPGFRGAAVLEVNAFGDYHRGVLHGGLDTYGAELRALLSEGRHAERA
ncbi:STM4014 family protein [Deinococcus maricopensis]|uniref:ATP-grasp domain-containing protein n=1 Tax=Deinococcus maricopensis (strain DSM 21211 / LMG 22137 / NRRL B-23946 / LB-34) TaxID=709986 RepID=E8U327_DEIML|nr:STM4014 family protein [Deinococcus maricopensis]ADV65765.1 hypothetical protein Deima_0101 [Deinococcus maricopensis DSM 21211]